MNEEDFDKKISFRFIQTLNRHLPAKRKTLAELLAESKPGTVNRDGSTHSFDRKELEKLASMFPEHGALKLPIYLEMSSSMERGSIRISGRLECAVIKKILGFGEKNGDSMIIYYPHLAKIRKEFSTSTQFMFTM